MGQWTRDELKCLRDHGRDGWRLCPRPLHITNNNITPTNATLLRLFLFLLVVFVNIIIDIINI
jgi:hypothetical protein